MRDVKVFNFLPGWVLHGKMVTRSQINMQDCNAVSRRSPDHRVIEGGAVR